MNRDRQKGDLWPLVEAIQREAGRGCPTAVNVTILFDSQGNYIGRSEIKRVKLLPSKLNEFLKTLFD